MKLRYKVEKYRILGMCWGELWSIMLRKELQRKFVCYLNKKEEIPDSSYCCSCMFGKKGKKLNISGNIKQQTFTERLGLINLFYSNANLIIK